MGGTASVEEGSNVTVGFFGGKKELPEGVYGDAMTNGRDKGAMFMATTSRKVFALVTAKGCAEHYANLKRDIVENAGGYDYKAGWQTYIVLDTIARYQPHLREKGVEVAFCKKEIAVASLGETYYWLEVRDLAVADPAYVAEELFTRASKPSAVGEPAVGDAAGVAQKIADDAAVAEFEKSAVFTISADEGGGGAEPAVAIQHGDDIVLG